MAAETAEYRVQSLPNASITPSSSSKFAEKWTPLIATAAKTASGLYLFVRVFFLLFSETNWWSWAIFYVECAFTRKYPDIPIILISTDPLT